MTMRGTQLPLSWLWRTTVCHVVARRVVSNEVLTTALKWTYGRYTARFFQKHWVGVVCWNTPEGVNQGTFSQQVHHVMCALQTLLFWHTCFMFRYIEWCSKWRFLKKAFIINTVISEEGFDHLALYLLFMWSYSFWSRVVLIHMRIMVACQGHKLDLNVILFPRSPVFVDLPSWGDSQPPSWRIFYDPEELDSACTDKRHHPNFRTLALQNKKLQLMTADHQQRVCHPCWGSTGVW